MPLLYQDLVMTHAQQYIFPSCSYNAQESTI